MMDSTAAAFTSWIPVLVLALITVVLVVRDPRRMRCAIFFGLTMSLILVNAAEALLAWLEHRPNPQVPYLVFGFFAVSVLLVLGAVTFLFWAGIALIIREGLRPANFLSILLAVVILVYLLATVVAGITDNFTFFVILFLLSFPLLLVSFTLFAYITYSWLYGLWAKKWAKPADVVVVLGSGLLGERVSPLLARRLDLGLSMYEKSLAASDDAILVVSGGQGPDEVVSEAEAMSKYVMEKGFARGTLLLEDQSTNTLENLTYSASLVAKHYGFADSDAERNLSAEVDSDSKEPPSNEPKSKGQTRWIAVTSDFHSFRAALLMSRNQITGHAVGAPSVKYFWANAKLREFAAILVQSRKTTAFFISITIVPIVFYTVNAIRELL